MSVDNSRDNNGEENIVEVSHLPVHDTETLLAEIQSFRAQLDRYRTQWLIPENKQPDPDEDTESPAPSNRRQDKTSSLPYEGKTMSPDRGRSSSSGKDASIERKAQKAKASQENELVADYKAQSPKALSRNVSPASLPSVVGTSASSSTPLPKPALSQRRSSAPNALSVQSEQRHAHYHDGELSRPQPRPDHAQTYPIFDGVSGTLPSVSTIPPTPGLEDRQSFSLQDESNITSPTDITNDIPMRRLDRTLSGIAEEDPQWPPRRSAEYEERKSNDLIRTCDFSTNGLFMTTFSGPKDVTEYARRFSHHRRISRRPTEKVNGNNGRVTPPRGPMTRPNRASETRRTTPRKVFKDYLGLWYVDPETPSQPFTLRHPQPLETTIWSDLLGFIHQRTAVKNFRRRRRGFPSLSRTSTDKNVSRFVPPQDANYHLATDQSGRWAALSFEGIGAVGSWRWTSSMDVTAHSDEHEFSEFMRIRFIDAHANKWHAEETPSLLAKAKPKFWGSVAFYPPDSSDVNGNHVRCAILDLRDSQFDFGNRDVGPPQWLLRVVKVKNLCTIAAWSFDRYNNSPASLALMTVPYGYSAEFEPLGGIEDRPSRLTDYKQEANGSSSLLTQSLYSGMSTRNDHGQLQWRSEKLGEVTRVVLSLDKKLMLALQSNSSDPSGFSQYSVIVRDMRTGFILARELDHTFFDAQIEDLAFWDAEGKEFCTLTWKSQFDKELELKAFDTFTGHQLYHVTFPSFCFDRPRLVPNAGCIIAVDLLSKKYHRTDVPMLIPMTSIEKEGCLSPGGLTLSRQRLLKRAPPFEITGPGDALQDAPALGLSELQTALQTFCLTGQDVLSYDQPLYGVWLDRRRVSIYDGKTLAVYLCTLRNEPIVDASDTSQISGAIDASILTNLSNLIVPDMPTFSNLHVEHESENEVRLRLKTWTDVAVFNEAMVDEIHRYAPNQESETFHIPFASLKQYWKEVCTGLSYRTSHRMERRYGVEAPADILQQQAWTGLQQSIFEETLERAPVIFNTIENRLFPASIFIENNDLVAFDKILAANAYIPFHDPEPHQLHRASDLETAVDKQNLLVIEELLEYAVEHVRSTDPLFLTGIVPDLPDLCVNYPSQIITMLKEISYFVLSPGAFAFRKGSALSTDRRDEKESYVETNLDVGYQQPVIGDKIVYFSFAHGARTVSADILDGKARVKRKTVLSLFEMRAMWGETRRWIWERFLDETLSTSTAKHSAIICALPLPGISEYVQHSNSWLKPRSIFSRLILDDILPDNPKFFDPPALKILVNYKWMQFGRDGFGILACLYLVHYASYSLATSITTPPPPAPVSLLGESNTFLTWHKVLFAVTFGLSSVFILQEFRQMLSGWRIYIMSPYNYVDLGAYVLPWTVAVLVFIAIEPPSQLVSFAAFVIWIHLLLQFRFFKATGIFIAILIEIFKEIWSYLLVLLIAIIAFAHVLYLLLRGETPDNGEPCQEASPDDNKFNTFDSALKSVVGFLTGQYDPVIRFTHNRMLDFYMVLFTLTTAIILLNVLIALLNQIYADVTARGQNAFIRQKAALLAEIEVYWMWPALRRNKDWFPNMIFYEAPTDEVRDWRKKLRIEKKRREEFNQKVLADDESLKAGQILPDRRTNTQATDDTADVMKQMNALSERIEKILRSQSRGRSPSGVRGRSESSRRREFL